MDESAEYGELEAPVYSPLPDRAALACIPVDEGCLRLIVENVQARDDPTARGALVDADCRANDAPKAVVETSPVRAGYGHGTLYIDGELAFDEGSSIELSVAAQRVDLIEGADCD